MNEINRQIIEGSCLCGAVTFTARLPSKWCAHCHCSLCRKAHGAGYVTWAGFEKDVVDITEKDGRVEWYESSPGAKRGFCQQCGSTMFFLSERWSGELHIAVGSLDVELDRQPDANAFFDAHVDWMPIDDRLTTIAG